MMKRLLSLASVALLLLWAWPARAVQLLIKQSAATPIQFLLVDSATGQTGQTGLSATAVVKISKAGGTGAASAGTVSEVDSVNFPGIYAYTPTTTETNTLGILTLHITCTGCQVIDTSAQIVAFDPNSATNLGLSNLDATVSSRNAGAVTLAAGQNVATVGGLAPPTNWNLATIDGAGKVTFNNTNIATVNNLAPPVRWNLMGVDGSGFVTYNNAAPPTVSQIAGGILATPANLLATNASGYVTSTNAGAGLTTQQANQLATAAGYTFPTNFGLLSINGTGYVTSTNAGTGLTPTQQTQLATAAGAQQAGSPVVLPTSVVPTADINNIVAAYQASVVDGSLTQKQLNSINAATALESDRTWNATTHTAVVTWYRRAAGSTTADKTKPVKTLTTVYDTTNVQIVSQTTSLTNLP